MMNRLLRSIKGEQVDRMFELRYEYCEDSLYFPLHDKGPLWSFAPKIDGSICSTINLSFFALL